jgi:protein SOK2
VGQTSSNLYSVMSNERASTNGTSTNDVYGSQGDMGAPVQNGYAAQPPMLNGSTSMKRSRDDDDDRSDLKRRKGMLDGPGSMPSPTYNSQMTQPAAAVATQRRR